MSTRTRELAVEAVAQDGLQRSAGDAGGAGAVVNSVQARVAAQGPAVSISQNAPAITKRGSGLMMITASASGTDATPSDTVSVQIARDGGVLSTEVAPVGADAGGTWQVSVGFLDTAPDGAAHTYSVAVTSIGGHNLTVAANRGVITVIEQ